MTRPTKKIKNCPVCGIEFSKGSTYCSKSCSNKGRVVTDEQKKKTSESMRKFMYSDSDVAEEARWRLNNHDKETDPVIPPTLPDRTYYRDGRDLWFADDDF